MKNKSVLLSSILIISLIISGCTMKNSDTSSESIKNVLTTSSIIPKEDEKYKSSDLDDSWNTLSDITTIKLQDNATVIDGDGVDSSDNIITISQAGNYILSGTLTNGSVVVKADSTSNIKIILNGVSIKNNSGSAIDIQEADKVVITLAKNSKNNLEDGKQYKNISSDSADATLYSNSDLTINGDGLLKVVSHYKDAIKTKDELVIINGNYNITSKEDGLIGKDSLAIKNGSFTINAGQDAIKSNHANETTKGWISIDGGIFNLNAKNDAIQAQTDLEINDGTFDITTGNGSSEIIAKMKQAVPSMPPMLQGENNNSAQPEPPSSMKKNDTKTLSRSINRSDKQENINNDTVSTKSTKTTTDNKQTLKASENIFINGGTFNLNSESDGLNSDKNIVINAGKLVISAGDDGIHAEENLVFTQFSDVCVTESNEGLEGKIVTINSGKIEVNSIDDGINATDGSAVQNDISAQDGVSININGGNILVNASGDGIDSNGNINITGGNTIIYGPENGGNGSIDYSGKAFMSKGNFISLGTSDMYQGFYKNSRQNTSSFLSVN